MSGDNPANPFSSIEMIFKGKQKLLLSLVGSDFNRYIVLPSNQIYYDQPIKLCFHRWSEIDPDWNAEAFKENGFKNGDD